MDDGALRGAGVSGRRLLDLFDSMAFEALTRINIDLAIAEQP
jgi:hypothetical protein